MSYEIFWSWQYFRQKKVNKESDSTNILEDTKNIGKKIGSEYGTIHLFCLILNSGRSVLSLTLASVEMYMIIQTWDVTETRIHFLIFSCYTQNKICFFPLSLINSSVK